MSGKQGLSLFGGGDNPMQPYPGRVIRPPGGATGGASAAGGGAFDAATDTAINEAATEVGVDPETLRTFARIESSGNPNARTGSYKGLFQLSDNEFKKHGGSGDIYDARSNARAAAIKIKAESEDFKRKYGRDPSATELYMIHQQGVGGSAAHWANPDKPAWQNMYSTAEGRQKGANWAKKAIWGNVPNDVKRQYGSVENMTSRDFTNMWGNKVQRFSLGGPKEASATATPVPVTQPAPTATPPATPANAAAGPDLVNSAAPSSAPQPAPTQGATAVAQKPEVLPWSGKPAAATAATQGQPEVLPWAGGQPAQPSNAWSPDMMAYATGNVRARRQQKMAEMLLANGMRSDKVTGPIDGILRLVSAVGGGMASKSADDATVSQQELMTKMMGGNLTPMEQFAFASGNDDLIKAVLAKRMDPASGKTAEVRNYEYGLENPEFAKSQAAKEAGRKPETAYGVKRAEGYVKRAEEIQAAATAANNSLNTISAMRQQMDDPRFYSGIGAEGNLLWKQVLSVLPGGDPNSAQPMEAFRSLANKSVMDGLNGSLGTGVSNADRSFIQQQVAQLGNTPEGNRQILDLKERLDRRSIEIAQKAREYEQQNGQLDNGFDAEIQAWAETNPLFGPGEALRRRGQAPGTGNFLPKQEEIPAATAPLAAPALPSGWEYGGAR